MLPSRNVSIVFLTLLALLAGCESFAPAGTPEGTRLVGLEHDNRQRSYWLHLPPAARDTALPLMIVLHGTGGDGERMLRLGNFTSHADQHDYAVAAPNALGRAFNEGSGRIGEDHAGVDDVAFIETVIADIGTRIRVAPGKIFITGFSSGGAMAQRMALESTAEIAAIASVSGHLWAPDRGKAIARPLLLMFGDSDPLNPVDGGPVEYGPDLVLNKPPHRVTAEDWAERFRCATSVRATIDVVKHRGWYGCTNGVRVILLSIEGLGHFWPGGPIRKYENLSADIVGPYQGKVDATSIIWDFFEQAAKAG